MTTQLNLRSQAIPAAPAQYTTGSVASKDGTLIGYRQFGHGPGLVIVHGSMSTGYNHVQLASLLADAFTVYVPDRRGFGLSPAATAEYGIQQDVEDLEALLIKTGAQDVFGVSAGGIICLRAALTITAIKRLAVYEPPLFPDRLAPVAMMQRFDREMAEGRLAAALTTAMKEAPLVSDFFSALPRWLLEPMTSRMMAFEEKQGARDYATFKELAPTLHHDGQLIIEMSGSQEELRSIRAQVLLLGGSASTAFLKRGLDSVRRALPGARYVELARLNHAASWNSDRGGHPEAVADALRRFFSAD